MIRVKEFEDKIAEFYGAPYAVATDCCTHAIELCLRLFDPVTVTCPNHTYASVPMTFEKLKIQWKFHSVHWEDYYFIGNTNIIDGAVFWKQNGYIHNTMLCLSFQHKKHLNIGRGGMILLDNKQQYEKLLKMRYDGRTDDKPWAEQDIDTIGYHYYMTPEQAEIGLEKLNTVKNVVPKRWTSKDYPNLKQMKVFNAK